MPRLRLELASRLMKIEFFPTEAKRAPPFELDPFHAEDALVEATRGADVSDGQIEMTDTVDLRRTHCPSATALSHDGTMTLG